jgi:triacylglycerol lipase
MRPASYLVRALGVTAGFAALAGLGCGASAGTDGSPTQAAATPASGAGVAGSGAGASSSSGQGAAGSGSGGTTPDGTPAKGAPYPIVLLHGMAGFDSLQNLPVNVTYFDGVVADLAKVGETQVYVTVAPPFDSSEERAKAIATQLDQILARTGAAKVNLIGHSQGGMDARVLASPAGLGYGDRIASVTTIATPHHGSVLTDAVLGLASGLPKGTIDALTSGLLGLLQKTAYDVSSDPHLEAQLTELTQAHMDGVFNPKYTDDVRVHYASYAGRTNLETGESDCAGALFPNDPSVVDVAAPEFVATAASLEGTAHTANDGLVTVKSAQWGAFMQCVPADHLKEVGVISPTQANIVSKFDHLVFFRDVVHRLRLGNF